MLKAIWVVVVDLLQVTRRLPSRPRQMQLDTTLTIRRRHLRSQTTTLVDTEGTHLPRAHHLRVVVQDSQVQERTVRHLGRHLISRAVLLPLDLEDILLRADIISMVVEDGESATVPIL